MIYTTVHKINLRSNSRQLTHIVEHSVIDNFYALLSHNNLSLFSVAWLEGKSTDESILLSAGFYNKDIYRLFMQYISSPITLNQDSVLKAVRSIGSEELMDIKDSGISDLTTICNNLLNDSVTLDNVPLREGMFKPNKSAYRDVTIGCYVENEEVTISEKKLFLRLSSLISQQVTHEMRNAFSAYLRGDTLTQKDENYMGYISVFTLPIKYENNTIEAELKKSLEDINKPSLYPSIKENFKKFAGEVLWGSVVIDYFIETGIWTTTEEISHLATSDNIELLLEKINILVRDTTELDWEVI